MCVRERVCVRERESDIKRVWGRMRESVCVCVCVRERERKREREREKETFISTALHYH